MKVIIMLGPSGSGKSTWAINNAPQGYVHLSADDFFWKEGRYQFDPVKLPDAHDECLREFADRVTYCFAKNSPTTVVVDNTNIRAWEIAPYYRLAEAFLGKESVEIVTVRTPPEVCVKRNIHGVPAEVIYRMCDTFEQLPPHWNQRTVVGC